MVLLVEKDDALEDAGQGDGAVGRRGHGMKIRERTGFKKHKKHFKINYLK